MDWLFGGERKGRVMRSVENQRVVRARGSDLLGVRGRGLLSGLKGKDLLPGKQEGMC